jgi:hypothetical protein
LLSIRDFAANIGSQYNPKKNPLNLLRVANTTALIPFHIHNRVIARRFSRIEMRGDKVETLIKGATS